MSIASWNPQSSHSLVRVCSFLVSAKFHSRAAQAHTDPLARPRTCTHNLRKLVEIFGCWSFRFLGVWSCNFLDCGGSDFLDFGHSDFLGFGFNGISWYRGGWKSLRTGPIPGYATVCETKSDSRLQRCCQPRNARSYLGGASSSVSFITHEATTMLPAT